LTVPAVLNVSTAAMARGAVKASTALATEKSLERGVEKLDFFIEVIGWRDRL
jgi:hypothetical protein